MTALYHRDLRRRIERLEQRYRPSPAPEIYLCWKNLAGEVVAIHGPRLRWFAEDNPGSVPPPIPSPGHLPPPITRTLRTGEAPFSATAAK